MTFRASAEAVLADGNTVSFETYAATVIWDGFDKAVLVLASDGGSLIGMSLLYGYRLVMDVIDGGVVTIEAKRRKMISGGSQVEYRHETLSVVGGDISLVDRTGDGAK